MPRRWLIDQLIANGRGAHISSIIRQSDLGYQRSLVVYTGQTYVVDNNDILPPAYTVFETHMLPINNDDSPPYHQFLNDSDEFLHYLNILNNIPHENFRSLARRGDAIINRYLYIYNRSQSALLRANRHFVNRLQPFWQSNRNIHNAGDQIEAAFYLSSYTGRRWFLLLIT